MSDSLVVSEWPRHLSTVPEEAVEDDEPKVILSTKTPLAQKWVTYSGSNRCANCVTGNRRCVVNLDSPAPYACQTCRAQGFQCHTKKRDRAADDEGKVLVVEVPRAKKLRKAKRPASAMPVLSSSLEDVLKSRTESADALEDAANAVKRIVKTFVHK